MCGIAGFYQGRSAGADELRGIVGAMGSALVHRGPDGHGVFVDHEFGIAMAHRRLAVIDLSENGAQPMVSASGRYVISYNGEIYNHKEIRKDFGVSDGRIEWRGHSDTEVMLAAIERWGMVEAVSRFNGMFAFAVWDRHLKLLHLGRDKFGEKPLYYACSNSTLLFGSEIRALRRHPEFQSEIDRDALTLFIRLKCIPAPYSIFRAVRKVSPGQILTFDIGAARVGSLEKPQERTYWNIRDVWERCRREPNRTDEVAMVGELESILRDSVGRRMEADVPLGAFLSGGVDSSTIVALMQTMTSRRVRTFTIGYSEASYDEGGYAAAVANHLGTDHTTLTVSPADAMNVIPELPRIFDEPFADPAQIPTYLVSRLARNEVVVSLSGDGGDELFGGYNRYLLAPSLVRAIQCVPLGARRWISRSMSRISPDAIDGALGQLIPFATRRRGRRLYGELLRKAVGLLVLDSVADLYLGLISQWRDPTTVVVGGHDVGADILSLPQWTGRLEWQQHMMAADSAWYLPSDVLVQLDRASMAVALECRVPYLDPQVYEFAWRLPRAIKIRDGAGKWPLRQLLDKYVPKSLIDRPKMGFGIPIDQWLRGPLRAWAESLLDPKRISKEGYLRAEPIAEKWAQHIGGANNWHYELWNVLMFQQWLEVYR